MRGVRQVPHFVRHDSKPPARLTRARRLNGCIQRQKVGLIGDARDHTQNIQHLLRVIPQVVYLSL